MKKICMTIKRICKLNELFNFKILNRFCHSYIYSYNLLFYYKVKFTGADLGGFGGVRENPPGCHNKNFFLL